MIKDFLAMNTPAAILIIILCIFIENAFPEVFEDDSNRKNIKVSIDSSNWRLSLFLIASIGVILFTPGINLVTSIVYCSFIMYQIIKHYRR